ncbi:MAG TPA: S41 family peptidase [Candidatus Saccharimonadales bacterium]|nr:S41 family peptidase [Candidatus Saccharimonadales bacterium]
MSKLDQFKRLFVVFLVAVGFFFGGYYFGKSGYIFEVRKNPPSLTVINQYPKDQKVDFALFWDVWNMIDATYLERPVDHQKMLYGAIQGMVASLGDPYTSFLPPKTNTVVNNAINGIYAGIGAELGFKDNQLVVISPIDGSPAKAAGIQAGDKILAINGQPTGGMDLNDAVAKIRGEENTTVTLFIQRGNTAPFNLTITRKQLTVPSVSWKDKGDGTAYIRVSRFGEDTNGDWDKAVSEIAIQMKQLDAVVVDVRGNPGGYLQSAVYLASEFFRDKPVLWEESPTGQQTPFMAKRVGNFDSVPGIIVLIDGGSASASEILSASLKENINAKLVGVKSFGKGTVQDTKDFKDGSGVHITIAKWLTPNKEWIHKVGLIPDYVVERTDKDVAAEKDPQLDKALELAKQF